MNLALLALLMVTPPAGAAQTAAEELRLSPGKSVVIDYPADISRISTSNADVVDAVAVSNREVLLNPKSQGISTVVIWSKNGQRTMYTVMVELNLEPMRKLLRETFPDENIQVQATRDSVALTGRASSQAVADRAAALVAPLAKTVVNNLQAGAPGPEKQIILRVKFAELNRNVAKSFGVTLLSTGAGNTPGLASTGQFNVGLKPIELQGTIPGRVEGTTSKFTISDALNVFAFRPDLNLSAFLRALQTQNVLQILAEPNLVTTNGKPASFLVGGEFPVPVVQGGANVGAVTILFKEFGIRLSFEPLITDHKTIRMVVKPEVSTIDLANAVTLSGFTIPALASRRMETSIELGEGQSFLIAGLLDERVTETLSKIPGLASIPVLGELFKSRQQNKARTELIVVVTPEIATPVASSEIHSPTMVTPFLGPVEPPPPPAKETGKEKRPPARGK